MAADLVRHVAFLPELGGVLVDGTPPWVQKVKRAGRAELTR